MLHTSVFFSDFFFSPKSYFVPLFLRSFFILPFKGYGDDSKYHTHTPFSSFFSNFLFRSSCTSFLSSSQHHHVNTRTLHHQSESASFVAVADQLPLGKILSQNFRSPSSLPSLPSPQRECENSVASLSVAPS